MVTAIIIVAAFAVLAAILILTPNAAKAGRTMQLEDPLCTITHDGILGFRLGDSIKFAWSRIIHLNLMSEKEIEDFKKEQEMYQMVGFGPNTIRIAKGKFSEIEGISMSFSGDKLSSILIYINPKPNTTNREYMKEIRDRCARTLGNPQVDSGMTYQWISRSGSVTLFYEKDRIIASIM